jgi:signal transduction histidine kinase
MNVSPPRSAFSWAQPVSSRWATAYLLALSLPFASAYLTVHVAVVGTIPFGLYYISIAAIGVLGGLAPSLVAATLCVLARELIVLPAHHLSPLELGDLFRIPTLYAQALLVSMLSARRRSTAQQLESALAALRERSDTLMASLHASKCACWTLDFDSGKSTRWYSGSYEIFGRPFEELEKMPSLRPLLHPDDQHRLTEVAASMRTTSAPIVFEHRVPWPNGELHYLEMRATREPGSGCVWRGVTVDITGLKLAELALLRQEKLAAMGRLASTVAHEINNPLEAVTNLLYLARNDPHLPEQARAYLKTAEHELARLGDITRLTLGFVRNSSVRRSIALATVVEEVLAIFRHRYEQKGIAIERRMDEGVCIDIAPHELRQILTNLISNATDALNVAQPRISIQILADPPNAIFILEDNGTGIPASVLPRIFDPFFTTKADVGTGIGLWVTRELVENNLGMISVESGALEDGMATRFRIELPLAAMGPL